MTVKYNIDVYSTTWFGLTRLLFRWRGSVWKAITTELIFWSFLYIVLNSSLLFLTNDAQRSSFEAFRVKLADQIKDYPLVFMLGFYVQVIFNRWTQIFQFIGFVDNLALAVSTAVRGTDVETRLLKRNVVRYSVLSQALVFRDISLPCRERWPDVEAFIDCGLMTQTECEIYTARKLPVSKAWIPIQWALNLLVQAREQNKIHADLILWNAQEKIREFRNHLQRLACFDWVPVPVAYPQIIYIAVRCYFALLLITSQIIKDPLECAIFYVPWVALIKFVLFAGWVKIAECLLNPFGFGDDDYECSYIIDRNLTMGLAIVDSAQFPPTDELDPLWSLQVAQPLDTITSKNKFKKETPYSGSVAEIDMTHQTQKPTYLVERARRRTLINRMVSNQSTNFTPSLASETSFFENPNQRFGSRHSKHIAQIHQLDDLKEIEGESRLESTTNSPNDTPSTSTKISILPEEVVKGETSDSNKT
ncbi:Bestrophin-like protein [Aphelenchoides bicaudatus]|nr:Bestrophin-like protein [Aphelenchoides bicaudatus]